MKRERKGTPKVNAASLRFQVLGSLHRAVKLLSHLDSRLPLNRKLNDGIARELNNASIPLWKAIKIIEATKTEDWL